MVRQLDDGDDTGTSLGQSASSLVSLYGVTPASQRASSIQALSLNSASTWISATSNLALFCAEVSATLLAIGAWKGAA